MANRILIADDNLVIRRKLRFLLEVAGFEVCAEAENGKRAIELALEFKPDVIIIDLVMPVMNGLAASRELSQKLPHVPIVLLSIHGSPEHEVEAKRSGVSRVVAKSESFKVVAMVQELLASGVPSPAVPSPSKSVSSAESGEAERIAQSLRAQAS